MKKSFFYIIPILLMSAYAGRTYIAGNAIQISYDNVISLGGELSDNVFMNFNTFKWIIEDGEIILSGTSSIDVPAPVTGTQAANKAYVDAQVTAGGSDNLGNHTATQNINFAGFKGINLATPTATTDAANKSYVDAAQTAAQAYADANDANTQNPFQTVSKVGTQVTLSNGGGTFSVIDPDGSPTNELQTISKNGTTVTLSDGGGSFEANNIVSKVLSADVSNNSTSTYTTILSFGVQSGRVYSGSVKLWFSPVAGESMQLRINPTSGTISGDLVDARDATATAVTNNSPITITDYASTGVSSTTLDFTFTATATTTANIQFRKAATGAGFSHIVEKGTKVIVDYIAE